MRLLTTILAAVFIICGGFENAECFENRESDRRFKEEVDDFADYLTHKLEKHPVSNSRFDAPFKLKTSGDQSEADDSDNYRENGKRRGDANLENFSEDFTRNNPESSDSLRNADKPLSKRRKLKFGVSAKQHGVEEIVYIRKSDSDLNDPVPEMIEKLLDDSPARRPTHDVQVDYPDAEHHFQTDDYPNVISPSEGVCPVKNIVSNLDQTCSDGPEYEMEFHPMLAETMRRQMLTMLPDIDENDSKCDINKPLGPETGVEDRALCPFVMNLNNHSSRLPEFLYEAKCSCTIPNLPRSEMRGKRTECVQVKRAIPVLWLVNCEYGKKRYRQGWDEIAVACAPLEEREGHVIDPPAPPA